MEEADKVALTSVAALVGGATVMGALDYVGCRLRNQKSIQQGQPDECIVPAIQSAFLSGLLAKLFGPIPLPLQVVQFVFQNRDLLQSPCHTLFCDPVSGQTYSVCASRREPDLYDYYGRPYYLRLPEPTFEGDCPWGLQ